MKSQFKYYTSDDGYGNPKFIKTGADGCEIITYLYPEGPWRKSEYSNPYPPDSGERLIECKKKQWDHALNLVKNKATNNE